MNLYQEEVRVIIQLQESIYYYGRKLRHNLKHNLKPHLTFEDQLPLKVGFFTYR